MENRFQDQLVAFGCFDKKILAAVSGGVDSVVLLHLLLKSRCRVTVAHANFQLRGQASDDDEAFVRKLAKDTGSSFLGCRFETNNYASEKGISIQMAARDLRYRWFDELLVEENLDVVLTAHHLNDNLETSIFNFTRGAGISGLVGMQKKNGNVIRPLLSFSREEIETYARENKLVWREDASNATDDYSRNFIRHQIIPRLKKLNPSLEETFKRNVTRLEATAELANRELDRIREAHVSVIDGQIRISKSITESLLHPTAILHELLKGYGFQLDQCHNLIEALNGQSGKQFLSSTHRLVIDRNFLIINLLDSFPEEVQIEAGSEEVVLGSHTMQIENCASEEIKTGLKQAMLDKGKLEFPLIWRKWKPGDSFFPLGMDHRKKLSDFLVDSKVSLVDKDYVTVIESGGEIAWVVGYRIDNRFKVVNETKSILSFRLK